MGRNGTMESMGLFYTAPNTPYFFEKRVLTTCPTVLDNMPHRNPVAVTPALVYDYARISGSAILRIRAGYCNTNESTIYEVIWFL